MEENNGTLTPKELNGLLIANATLMVYTVMMNGNDAGYHIPDEMIENKPMLIAKCNRMVEKAIGMQYAVA